MSTEEAAQAPGLHPKKTGEEQAGSLRYSQIVFITVAAVALYAGFRALPTGTNLHQVDFNTQGKGMIELCDPSNPQFVAVTTARSPVTMAVRTDAPAATGREARLTLTLATSTGKPVGDRNLLVQHTRKLHLLVVDPTLHDYQHLHPEPGEIEGEWTVAFTPRLAGTYRVFADFVPVPTGRSLYTGADLTVAGEVVEKPVEFSWSSDVDGHRFQLTPSAPLRAGQPADLVFTVRSADGSPAPVPLEPVMDAYAHLVAFDQAHSGFAHLHPVEPPLQPFADPAKPVLNFKITIPYAGIYVIWAQVKLAGREVFAPFWFEVAP